MPSPSKGKVTLKDLNSLLVQAGLTLTLKEKKHLLTLAPATITKKLRMLKQAKAKPHIITRPSVEELPVLLSLIDGKTSKESYRILAVHDSKKLSLRLYGVDRHKVKFHPTLDAWGLTLEDLRDVEPHSLLHRQENEPIIYDRVFMSSMGVENLLRYLIQTMPGVKVASEENVERILEGNSPYPDSPYRIARPQLQQAAVLPPRKAVGRASVLKSRPRPNVSGIGHA